MKPLLISTTSLISVLAALPALAQEAPTPDVTASVGTEEIVVTATRSPQNLERIGSSLSIVTRADIETAQAVAVSDLISRLPGVSFSRNGGVGGTTSLRIRGAETDQTTVIIDGVKLNDPSSTGGGYNFANLLTGDIARIEVLRGAQSTLWGSQAIGGVVNIVTAQPTKPFEVSASVEGGSHNTGSTEVGVGGATDRLVWRLAGDYHTEDGISAFINGREDDGYHHAGASGRLRYNITDTVAVDLRGVYSRGKNQFDGFPAPAFVFADTLEYGRTEEFVGYAGLSFDLLNGRLKNRVAYAYTDTNRDNFNPDQAVTPVTFDAAGKNKRWEYQGSFAFVDGVDAIFGLEHEASSFRTASPSAFDPNPVPASDDVSITSGYTQVQAEVVPGLTLTGGLRYDSHDTFGDRLLGQVAGAWSLNGGDTVLRASFGQGFKAPTLYQLHSVYGNTTLAPEKADSVDAGITQHLFGDLLSVTATGFYRKTQNQIDFVSCPGANPLCTPGKPGVYDNTASTKAKGVELESALKFEGLELKANYTYTKTENTSAGSANRGKELTRRPKNAVNVSADYAWPWDISTGVSLRYVGKTFDNAANSFVLPDYTTIDLRVSWDVTENVELYGRIENLFDEVYSTTRNYSSPRRGAFAGVRAKF
ncbi:MAG: TonB-dependent receptor [Rhodospirillaceae bacterium]|nr:TonB-dependent receptor [Rhodospirillaceae bacterium]